MTKTAPTIEDLSINTIRTLSIDAVEKAAGGTSISASANTR